MTVDAAAETAIALVAGAHGAGLRATVTLAVAFGCPFEGRVDPGLVVAHAERMASAGADEVMLADTIGVAVPGEVGRLVAATRTAVGGVPVGLHLCYGDYGHEHFIEPKDMNSVMTKANGK